MEFILTIQNGSRPMRIVLYQVALAYELEARLRKADGSYCWFLARYNPVRENKGQVMRWYVACTDIDDRKQAEDTLHRENIALREEIDKASMFEEIVGTSPALQTGAIAHFQSCAE